MGEAIAGMPFVEYAAVIAEDGFPDHQVRKADADKLQAEMALDASHDAPRCGDCFEFENLQCEGFAWTSTEYSESEGTIVHIACPKDLDEEGLLLPEGRGISILLNKRIEQ